MMEPAELAALEEAVQDALEAGQPHGLNVLGYGEISLVLGWPAAGPRVACKRLPPFPDQDALAAYQKVLFGYLGALDDAGVAVLPTELHRVQNRRQQRIGYVLQSVLPSKQLGPNQLRGASPDPEHPLVKQLLPLAAGAVSFEVGLDAQLSNWMWDGEQLRYLDVTTPMLRRSDGLPRLDPGIFLTAYPWLLRGVIRRMVPQMMARYHAPRSVLLDICANLIKERLQPWLPVFVEACNDLVEPSLTEDEVVRDYRSDARLWRMLEVVRRWDRCWQRRVRRRPYPFLLPPKVAR